MKTNQTVKVLESIETKLNFAGIQEAAARRQISVNQYLHEYAEQLSKLYLDWLREQGKREV